MQRNFIIQLAVFIIPIFIGYAVLEYYTRKLPLSYTYIQSYLEQEFAAIEVMVLGSSQINKAINPAYIEKKTINLSSAGQHHDTDFRLLKQLKPKLPELKTVILEVSYSHFELPHNGPKFWKNHIFYHYYGLNTFDRNPYFKDDFIYLSNPPFYYEKLRYYYGDYEIATAFNRYGYDTLKFYGLFRKLEYDPNLIAQVEEFKINKTPDASIFKTNVELFFEMLDYMKINELDVILCEAPMYKTYLEQRNPTILRRRDSVLKVAEKRYTNVSVVRFETDTTHFVVKDFIDQNHLNPKGGEKFSKKISEILLQKKY